MREKFFYAVDTCVKLPQAKCGQPVRDKADQNFDAR